MIMRKDIFAWNQNITSCQQQCEMIISLYKNKKKKK